MLGRLALRHRFERTTSLLGLAAMLAVFFSTASWAQAGASGAPTASSLFAIPSGSGTTTSPVTGSPADAPIQWLQNIFLGTSAPETFLDSGTLCGGTACGDENKNRNVQAGLRQVLSWYSYAILVLASFLMLDYLLRIVAETAHTGRPGGKANQLWAPIRVVPAIGLLIPPSSTRLNSGLWGHSILRTSQFPWIRDHLPDPRPERHGL